MVMSSYLSIMPLTSGSFSDYQYWLGTVLMIILAIICVVSLTVLAINIFKGDRDSVGKLVSWVVISACGFAMLAVMR